MRYECHINYDDCDFCSECVEYCSGKALTIVNNQIQFQADKCTNCELCSDDCPAGAIWIETLEYEELSEMTETKRFLIDDAGELIDLKNHKFIDYGDECCKLLNELSDENEQLKQYKQSVNDVLKSWSQKNLTAKQLQVVLAIMEKLNVIGDVE